jgi:hypothetical protein
VAKNRKSVEEFQNFDDIVPEDEAAMIATSDKFAAWNTESLARKVVENAKEAIEAIEGSLDWIMASLALRKRFHEKPRKEMIHGCLTWESFCEKHIPLGQRRIRQLLEGTMMNPASKFDSSKTRLAKKQKESTSSNTGQSPKPAHVVPDPLPVTNPQTADYIQRVYNHITEIRSLMAVTKIENVEELEAAEAAMRELSLLHYDFLRFVLPANNPVPFATRMAKLFVLDGHFGDDRWSYAEIADDAQLYNITHVNTLTGREYDFKPVSEALKKTMAPLGYRKTHGFNFVKNT